MADDIDAGNERAEQFRQDALAKVLTIPRTISTGICKLCSERIEPDRLKANPHARHCRDCAGEIEEAAARVKKVGR